VPWESALPEMQFKSKIGGASNQYAYTEIKLIAMKLKSLINGRTEKLGSTPTGSDWCLKALHPADPLTEVRGVPDQSSVPSVFLNFQTVGSVKPSSHAVGTWGCDL